jgi:hypothetical protein
MAGTYTGENGADAALNKMIKHMDRNANRGPAKRVTILSQLQERYPDTWREELAEMRKESADPDYLAAKTAARKRFSAEYWAQPRHLIVDMDNGERNYVNRAMAKWIDEQK